jgi:HNH endonuclease
MTARPKTDLTADFVKEILDYDPATGIFRWKRREAYTAKWNNKHAGNVAGCVVRGYIQIRVSKDTGCHPAHRLAWLVSTGRWPKKNLDHINREPADNRIANLRECDQSENGRNRPVQKNNKSGHAGVFYRPDMRKWVAKIYVGRKCVWRAYAASAQEAAALRRAALPQHHGVFAYRDD